MGRWGREKVWGGGSGGEGMEAGGVGRGEGEEDWGEGSEGGTGTGGCGERVLGGDLGRGFGEEGLGDGKGRGGGEKVWGEGWGEGQGAGAGLGGPEPPRVCVPRQHPPPRRPPGAAAARPAAFPRPPSRAPLCRHPPCRPPAPASSSRLGPGEGAGSRLPGRAPGTAARCVPGTPGPGCRHSTCRRAGEGGGDPSASLLRRRHVLSPCGGGAGGLAGHAAPGGSRPRTIPPLSGNPAPAGGTRRPAARPQNGPTLAGAVGCHAWAGGSGRPPA